jgi:hypothetical protein
MLRVRHAMVLGAAVAISACSSSPLPSLSTGSLFGSSKPAPLPGPAPETPTARAFQVGTASARAIKCGFNFDPVKLKTQYLAYEAAANPADTPKIEKIYDVAFNGVSKAVAGAGEEYCSANKVATVKEDLARHLAGDYSPAQRAAVAQDTGLFGGGAAKDTGYTAKHPMDNSADGL